MPIPNIQLNFFFFRLLNLHIIEIKNTLQNPPIFMHRHPPCHVWWLWHIRRMERYYFRLLKPFQVSTFIQDKARKMSTWRIGWSVVRLTITQKRSQDHNILQKLDRKKHVLVFCTYPLSLLMTTISKSHKKNQFK